jgi:hypothetical protein
MDLNDLISPDTPLAVSDDDEDTRPIMTGIDVMSWSKHIISKVDESIELLTKQYRCAPEVVLALYGNVGVYAINIAEAIHSKLKAEIVESPPLAVSTRYRDPNRGYL